MSQRVNHFVFKAICHANFERDYCEKNHEIFKKTYAIIAREKIRTPTDDVFLIQKRVI